MLWNAIDYLVTWQQRNAGNTKNRCLEAVRAALAQVDLKLPKSHVDYKGMLAIDCGKTLAFKPSKWGWRLLGTSYRALPNDRPTLVFFKSCAFLPKYGRFAGHIAIYKPSTNRHIANASYNMSVWWRWRVCYVFEPEGTEG